MTSARFFDVVVLGTRLGALACAALLARRDFRVLLLGDGARPATYGYDGVPLRRRTFAHLAAPSPAWRRVIGELAQSQAFRRRLRPLEPMVQVLEPNRRIELPPDPALFARELDRELPSARASIEGLYATLARINARVDDVFEEDAVWPPGTFWERRETARLREMLPLQGGDGRTLHDGPDGREQELSIDARYRSIVDVTARHTSDLAFDPASIPPLLLARLHGAWTRGVLELPGDEDELSAALIERIRAHGGDVRPNERCLAILHKRGRISGVVVDGSDEPIGCAFVVGDSPTLHLLDRVRDPPPLAHPAASLHVARRRFVLSLVVRTALVPPPLARHSFLTPKTVRSATTETHETLTTSKAPSPAVEVHLHRATFPLGHPHPALAALGAELWVAEALLDETQMERATSPTRRARKALLSTLRDHFPYLDRHLLLVDSPHDGAPLDDYRDGTPRSIARARFRSSGAEVDPEPADAQYHPDPHAYAGLAGEPIRTPISHLLTVAPTVLPALGVEGELLAAWGAARVVTRSDRRKEKMRREMWSKIEI